MSGILVMDRDAWDARVVANELGVELSAPRFEKATSLTVRAVGLPDGDSGNAIVSSNGRHGEVKWRCLDNNTAERGQPYCRRGHEAAKDFFSAGRVRFQAEHGRRTFERDPYGRLLVIPALTPDAPAAFADQMVGGEVILPIHLLWQRFTSTYTAYGAHPVCELLEYIGFRFEQVNPKKGGFHLTDSRVRKFAADREKYISRHVRRVRRGPHDTVFQAWLDIMSGLCDEFGIASMADAMTVANDAQLEAAVCRNFRQRVEEADMVDAFYNDTGRQYLLTL